MPVDHATSWRGTSPRATVCSMRSLQLIVPNPRRTILEATIAVRAGDGIGVDVTAEAVKVLKAVAEKFGHRLSFPEGLVGGIAIDRTGNPLPGETMDLCKR